jgi:hypothetical protein
VVQLVGELREGLDESSYRQFVNVVVLVEGTGFSSQLEGRADGCKRVCSVEVSSFGSEFVALRIGTEMLKALRYKHKMFGIPLEESANVFCDHQSVVTNLSTPDSVLKRKHNSIAAYHFYREAIASGMMIVRKVASQYDIDDLFTKCLPPKARQYRKNHCIGPKSSHLNGFVPSMSLNHWGAIKYDDIPCKVLETIRKFMFRILKVEP